MNKTKICSKCCKIKLLNEENFELRKDGSSKDGFRGVCLDCLTIYRKEYHLANREHRLANYKIYRKNNLEKFRAYNLGLNFGITLEQFQELLCKQENCCAICRNSSSGKKAWNVDHDHSCCNGRTSCGKCIRGLLCHSCNTSLGGFKDNPELLTNAINYLLKYKRK